MNKYSGKMLPKFKWILLLQHSVLFFRHVSLKQEKCLLALSCLSICLATHFNSAPTGQISVKSDIGVFYENLSK